MKSLKFFGMTLLIVMCTLNFAACSNDNEIDKIIPEDNTLQFLVGSWEYKDNYNVKIYQFNADYSYTYSYSFSGEILEKKGTYHYYSDRHILTLMAEYDTNNYAAVTIVEVSKDKLVLAWNGEAWEYTRKK